MLTQRFKVCLEEFFFKVTTKSQNLCIFLKDFNVGPNIKGAYRYLEGGYFRQKKFLVRALGGFAKKQFL